VYQKAKLVFDALMGPDFWKKVSSIYEVIISPKRPTKNLKHFCHGSLLEGRAEILQILGETMTS
jgi:hypothetical protein